MRRFPLAMRWGWLLGLMFASPVGANNAAPDNAVFELAVHAMPLGDFFDQRASADPSWPSGAIDRFEPARLACLRRTLSSQGMRAQVGKAIVAMEAREPEQLELLRQALTPQLASAAADAFRLESRAEAPGTLVYGVVAALKTVDQAGSPQAAWSLYALFLGEDVADAPEVAGSPGELHAAAMLARLKSGAAVACGVDVAALMRGFPTVPRFEPAPVDQVRALLDRLRMFERIDLSSLTSPMPPALESAVPVGLKRECFDRVLLDALIDKQAAAIASGMSARDVRQWNAFLDTPAGAVLANSFAAPRERKEPPPEHVEALQKFIESPVFRALEPRERPGSAADRFTEADQRRFAAELSSRCAISLTPEQMRLLAATST